MPKLDEIKARIDWLKELFKIIVTIMVADIAGMAKLYLDNTINGLFVSTLKTKATLHGDLRGFKNLVGLSTKLKVDTFILYGGGCFCRYW